MERLSPLDAMFLLVEDDVNHMHIGSVAVFEGPPPPYDDLRAMIAGKLPLVPRYRQRVRFVPFNLGRPIWVDDPHFLLDYHLRHTALPAPGGREELENLVGRVMSQQLDRARPLWETWIVEGLQGGTWALLSKVHHSIVDGVAGTDLLTVVLDETPEPPRPVRARWHPEPGPSTLALTSESIAEALLSPFELIHAAKAVAEAPLLAARWMAGVFKGLPTLGALFRPAPEYSLVGPVGPHRRWSWTQVSLADVKAIRAALGGTVNDVLLAAITNGYRELLLTHGDDPHEAVVRSLIPVSTRREDEHGMYNNRVSAMFAELPVDLADPVERLDRIRDQLGHLKGSGQAVAAETLTSMAGFGPPMLLSVAIRTTIVALRRLPHSSVTTVVTNVPGPQRPLYAAGRRMITAYPYVPIMNPARVGVAIFSYDGTLTFGVTGDFDTIPDLRVLCRGIDDGVAGLLARADRASRPRAPSRPARGSAGSTAR